METGPGGLAGSARTHRMKRRDSIVLAGLVLSGVALHAAPGPTGGVPCTEFQFAVSVPFSDANGKQVTTTAYLWIPEHCRTVRGLLLAQQNVAEQAFAETPAIRQACREVDMAIVWFYPAFAPTFEHPGQDGAVLQKALDELAMASGYEELAVVPWLPFGHSTMGNFVQQLANWKPGRCIAQLVFKSKVDLSLPDNRQVPLFELGGQFTEWNQHKKDWTEKAAPNFWAPAAISKDRALTRRPMSYLLECGSSHFVMTGTEAEMMAMYIRKAVATRLPAGADGKLTPVDIDRGWVVDLNMDNPRRSAAQPVKTAKDEARNGVWFFDEEMARAVEKRMTVNWRRKTQVPVLVNADGSIPSFDNRGLLMWLPPAPAEDGVTIQVKTAFLERIPTNFTIGAGQPLGHSSQGPIQLGWLGGNVEVTGPESIRATIDRRRTVYSAMIWVRHPGDDQYRPSVQPVGTGIISNKAGKPQTITFPSIPDQAAGTRSLEMQATSDAGLPVEYCVVVGPARVSGNVLTFTGIPPRSRFPIKVTVLAYQYGRSAEPAVQSARWVEQTFQILGK